MKSSDLPTLKFPIVWGANAGPGYIRDIPVDSQIGIQDGAASLSDGYPPLTMTPVGAGGVWPFGQDTNGILKEITSWLQWYQAGAPVSYDSSFSSTIGGYPKGAILQVSGSPGWYWLSTVNDNTSDPDTGGVVCSCGASSPRNGASRFLTRHPRLCTERRNIAHQLAQGVRCVDDPDANTQGTV